MVKEKIIQTPENKTQNKSTTTFLIMMGMSTAFLLVTPVLLLLGLGFVVDKFFHTTPFYMVLGIAIGLIGGVANVYRLMQAMWKKKNN
ncbi:MAG TPA: AtpZ/AtpI family protein [Candidatus Saccharimonadales bacterium]|nr:AtpZ/AtpI family protein [Candidatus Saccharimonadales bacterium]